MKDQQFNASSDLCQRTQRTQRTHPMSNGTVQPKMHHMHHMHQQMNQMNRMQSRPNKRVKRVRFSPTSTLTVFRPSTPAELRAAWYDRHEIVRFKREMKLCAMAFGEMEKSEVVRDVRRLYRSAELEGQIEQEGAHAEPAEPTEPREPSASTLSPTSLPPSSLPSLPSIRNNDEILGLEHLVSEKVAKLLLKRRRLAVYRVIHNQDVLNAKIADNAKNAKNSSMEGEKESDGCSGRDSCEDKMTHLAHVSLQHSKFAKAWSSKIAIARAA